MAVSKSHGKYICFNPGCDIRGGLEDLVIKTTGAGDFQVMRMLMGLESKYKTSTEKLARSRRKKEVEYWPDEVIEDLHQNLLHSPKALNYLYSRGFSDNTIKEYRVGYSIRKGMISTPMFDIDGRPVGTIGRGVEEKVFRNSVNLPKGDMLWNMHKAKRYETIIICEANFDAMRISQAGYPNVVACLGGHFSEEHASQLERHATQVIIMTDNDNPLDHVVENCRRCKNNGLVICRGHNPGRKLGNDIAEKMLKRGRVVKWAVFSEDEIYPSGAKDAGDMTDEQIARCIKNSESNFRYQRRMKNVVV